MDRDLPAAPSRCAALVARQFGKPAVVGVSELELDLITRKMVVSDGDPKLYQVWQRVEHNEWDLDQDLERFCLELGFDPKSGSAGYQRFNRLRKKIRMYARQCYEDKSSPTPQTH